METDGWRPWPMAAGLIASRDRSATRPCAVRRPWAHRRGQDRFARLAARRLGLAAVGFGRFHLSAPLSDNTSTSGLRPRRAGGNRRHGRAFGLQARSVISARHRSRIPVGRPAAPAGACAPPRDEHCSPLRDGGNAPDCEPRFRRAARNRPARPQRRRRHGGRPPLKRK